MATIKQCVSSTLDDIGQSAFWRRILQRIIFMAMMNELEVTDKPHKNDDLRFQQAQEVRDYVARFRPGYLIFVGPGSEKTWSYDKWDAENPNGSWDRKTPNMVQK